MIYLNYMIVNHVIKMQSELEKVVSLFLN